MIRVGIVGWNEKVRSLADRIHSKIKNTELLGWATSHKEGIAYARSLGLKHIFRSATQLYEIHQLDVICFFNSSEDHETLVEDALKSGVNVFVDYPLAHNIDEAIHLKQIVEHFPSLRSLIVFPRRYNPHFIRMKKILADGQLGDIRQIKISNFKTTDPFITDKGIFMNHMIEDIDMLHWLLEDHIVNAMAVGTSSEGDKKPMIEDVNQASAIGYTEKGGSFNLFAKNNASHGYLDIEIWGAEGRLTYSSKDDESIKVIDDNGMSTNIFLTNGEIYHDIFEDFIYKIAQGDRVITNINDAVNATKVAVALSKSYVLKLPETIVY